MVIAFIAALIRTFTQGVETEAVCRQHNMFSVWSDNAATR